MARNKFDVDEQLETPFDIRHLKRSLIYVGRYKRKVALSLSLSAIAVIIGLLSPLIVQNAIDNYMGSTDTIPQLLLSGLGVFACIVVSVIFSKIRSKMMTELGQDIE